MPLIEWDESMSVGVKEMDDDHKQLIALLNELNESFETHQERQALGAVLEKVIQYTRQHLAREEKLLAKCQYPMCDEHHKEHDQLIHKALNAQAHFRCGGEVLTADVMHAVHEDVADESHSGIGQGIRPVHE